MKISKELLMVALVLSFISFGFIYAEYQGLNGDLDKVEQAYAREIALSNILEAKQVK